MKNKEFTKIVHLGNLNTMPIFCKVSYKKKEKGFCLSISGVINPRNNGKAYSCGQINMGLEQQMKERKFTSKHDSKTVKKFLEIWDNWHLNDMNAGTPKQKAALKGFSGDYLAQCEHLESLNLYCDNGYKYGHRWLFEEVPADVITFLRNMPKSELVPVWV